MEIKVTLEDYKDIQEFKNSMNQTCDKMVKDLRSTFNSKQVDILNQIDRYLKNIALQLKGTKPCGYSEWTFADNDTYRDSNNNYPSQVRVHLENDGNYYLKVKLYSPFSGEKQYEIHIHDGDIEIHMDNGWGNNIEGFNRFLKEKKQFYIETIIKSWKDLKKNINNRIIEDLEESQKINSNKINTIVQRNAIYDNFEL